MSTYVFWCRCRNKLLPACPLCTGEQAHSYGFASMPVADDVELGDGVVIYHPELVNLYGCSIGRDTTIAPFVEIGRGVRVGSRCKISTHSYLCMGVTIEDEVFIGH